MQLWPRRSLQRGFRTLLCRQRLALLHGEWERRLNVNNTRTRARPSTTDAFDKRAQLLRRPCQRRHRNRRQAKPQQPQKTLSFLAPESERRCSRKGGGRQEPAELSLEARLPLPPSPSALRRCRDCPPACSTGSTPETVQPWCRYRARRSRRRHPCSSRSASARWTRSSPTCRPSW